MIAVLLLLLPAQSPSVEVSIRRPADLGRFLLSRFEGSRAESPAAALAAYRQAHGGVSGLSKGAEAAIAAINPRMVAELGLLDDARISIGRNPDGSVGWHALIPRDDGSIAALGTAFALTDGARLDPIDGAAVDRLGPPGAPLLATTRRGLVLASDRATLDRAMTSPLPPAPVAGDLAIRLDSKSLADPAASLTTRRVGEALLGLKVDASTIAIEHADDRLVAVIRPTPVRRPGLSVRPRWLDAYPDDPAILAAFAIDPSPSAVASRFALVDRVEKVDPLRANVAPSRLRLALITRGAGLNLESDLWPHLIGISGCATTDAAGTIDMATFGLHADTDAAAARIAAMVPRLARSLKLKMVDPETIDVGGTPLRVSTRGDTVLLTWGNPDRLSRVAPVGRPPILPPGGVERFAMVRPGRIARLGLPGPSVITWRTEARPGEGVVDVVEWDRLKPTVKAFLDRLAMEPPPDVTPRGPR